MSDPTSGNWGSSGDNPLGSSGAGPRRRATGPGFYSYLQDHLNRSGGLQPRKGTTSAFKGGELDGLNQAQAEAHIADKYQNAPDEEVAPFQPEAPAATSPVATAPDNGAVTQTQPAAIPAYAGPSPATNPYGSNSDSDLARLRAAGKVGPNQTISDPDQFKAAVADLDAKSNSYAAPSPTPATPAAPIAPIASTPTPAPVVMPVMGDPNDTARYGPRLSGGGDKPVASTVNMPAIALGAVDGIDGPKPGPVTTQPAEYNRSNGVLSSPPVPVIGSGASDSSGTADKYAGPTPAPPGNDIDPATGKKKTILPMS